MTRLPPSDRRPIRNTLILAIGLWLLILHVAGVL